ncbi:unnamed protein product [Psylliodes chrysocephalus]|uniref:CGG triplet repeat-binding protein 1 n=1 Tax=Psylliodes chrysocephalus TaxID=3402493 RepID=A0A9P0CNH8_9CUCU|nr:unnamed protein product [Psylliodes chrysocephala]
MSNDIKVSMCIKPFPEFSMDMGKVFCSVCSKIIISEKRFLILQHVKTASHVAKQGKVTSEGKKQPSISKCFQSNVAKSSSALDFRQDLCRALVTSNIPLSKLSNDNFQFFLQKYCKFNIPIERTLRRTEIDYVYSSVLNSIILEIVNNHFL